MQDFPVIPGGRDCFDGPVRDVHGNNIGRSDTLFGVTPDRLPQGRYLYDTRGELVGEVGILGAILPPPTIGRR